MKWKGGGVNKCLINGQTTFELTNLVLGSILEELPLVNMFMKE